MTQELDDEDEAEQPKHSVYDYTVGRIIEKLREEMDKNLPIVNTKPMSIEAFMFPSKISK